MSLAPETVSVNLGERSYKIAIGSGLLPGAAEFIASWRSSHGFGDNTGLIAVICDERVRMHADAVASSLSVAGNRVEVMELPSGEPTKRLEVIASVYDRLVELQADRRTVIVAVGGGVTGDAAGFAAATYARGLPFVQVPTTLLADVDSSVGGKVGINHAQAKNLIGAFHQPMGVLIDTDALKTLPAREFNAGLAEVVKYGVILDGEFFSELEQQVENIRNRDPDTLRRIIARSCRLKADVVEQDEYERTGLRAVLNYGHTFGHAFEALRGYGELLHGEAVAIGMVYASRLAEKLDRITADDTARQIQLLEKLDLPTRLPKEVALSGDAILDCMRLDKKTVGGRLRFILPTKIGHVKLVDGVPEELLRELLTELGG